MTEYIDALKRALRDQHDIAPTGGTTDSPLFEGLPDGDYPVVIEGKLDYMKVVDGKFNCCNYGNPAHDLLVRILDGMTPMYPRNVGDYVVPRAIIESVQEYLDK